MYGEREYSISSPRCSSLIICRREGRGTYRSIEVPSSPYQVRLGMGDIAPGERKVHDLIHDWTGMSFMFGRRLLVC